MEPKITAIIFGLGIVALVYPSSAQLEYQVDGLDAHNTYREIHGSPPMYLDDAMNEAAEECALYYAEQGRIDHTCETEDAGENLYARWGGSGSPNLEDAVKSAVKRWYDENVTYNYDDPGDSSGVTGHFTQLVWKSSTALGIGAATVDGYTAVVGKYSPYGNVRLEGDDVDEYQLYKENVEPPAS